MSDQELHLCDTCREYDEFQHACIHRMIDQNKVWVEKYRIKDCPRWDYSMDDATLTFSVQGEAKVICNIEVVGSTNSESWEWSWGNETLPLACRRRMGEVYKFGEERQWERMTTLFLENNRHVGWECASVACHVLGGLGVYRCPNSDRTEEDAVYVVVLSAEFVN